MTVGQKIKNFREILDLTQQQLADKSKISRIAIGNYERDTRTPDVEKIVQIANSLGVSINRLLINELGFYLRYLMRVRKTSIEQLSADSGLDQSILEEIRRGFIPDKDVLMKIANGLTDNTKLVQEYYNEFLGKSGYAFYEHEPITFWDEYNENLLEDDFSMFENMVKKAHNLEQAFENYENKISIPIYLDKNHDGYFHFINDGGLIDDNDQQKIKDIIKMILKD